MGEDLPTGTVTFLFTDIEGSTRLWERDRPAMEAALAAHDLALRNAIESHRGTVFKHTGDGVCAVFASANDAVAAARDAQSELDLPVRMGVHTGEAQLRGDDYFGPSLNRTARIMDAGHGGQVLISGVVASLLEDSTLVDLGRHRLRDLEDPEHLYQVRHRNDRESYGALRTMDASVGNLPGHATRFVGREAQLAQLGDLLPASRLVTLTGVGGVGKSRLALQVAADALPSYPDGAWLIELAALGDPDALAHVVAGVLGVTRQAEASTTESLVAALASQRMLLMLDNCEHLIDAVADLAGRILGACTEVTILATSREALGVEAERTWPVPSLTVDSDGSAVELFVDRCLAANPSFRLDERTENVVAEICARLDGIPLAIELAAARTRSMTVAEIRDRLDERFRFLTGGSRRGVERHQTLRQAVQWSYDLLDDAEQRALRRLAVFAGGFDLEAVERIVNVDGWVDTLDLLDALVRKSLVTVSAVDGTSRYGLLETIRQFAEDELMAGGEVTEARTQHARHFAQRAEKARRDLVTADHAQVLRWCDRELANLRAAYRWCLDTGDIDDAVRIVSRVCPVAVQILHYEVLDWAFELAETIPETDRVRLLPVRAAAAECWRLGLLDQARAHADAAIDAIDDPQFDIDEFVFTSMFSALNFQGRVEDGIAFARRGRSRPGEQNCGLCSSLEAWGTAAVGRYRDAQRIADEAVRRSQRDGNPMATAFAHAARGRAYEEDDPGLAMESFRLSADIAGEAGNLFLEGIAIRDHAASMFRDGLSHDALDEFERMLVRWHRAGDVANQRSTYGYLVVLLHRLGRPRPAAVLAGVLGPDVGGVTFTKAEADRLDEAIADLEHQLSAESLDAAVSHGRAMSAREAYEFTLDEIRAASLETPRPA